MDIAGLLILLLAGLALGWAMLVLHTAHGLMRPGRRSYGWAVARNLPGDPSELRLPGLQADSSLAWTQWTIRAGRHDLPVWDITGLDPAGPPIILTHGWGDSRVVMLASGRVAALLPRCSRLLVWDMPGHGDSPRVSRCTLGRHETRALLALLDQATDNRPPVLYGFSLGAVISIAAARAGPARAVIAEAPYLAAATPARNILRLSGLPYRATLGPALSLVRLLNPIRTPGSGAARSASDGRRAPCPLLVLHGDADAISPPADGQSIAQASPSARFVPISGGQHQSLWTDPATRDPAAHAVRVFLDSLGSG